jgi:hypothetical protein
MCLGSASARQKTIKSGYVAMLFKRWVHSGILAIAVGLLCLLTAGWFLLWTMSAADLAFVPCNGRYTLTAEVLRCRVPALTSLAFIAATVLVIVLTAIGLLQTFGNPKLGTQQ